VGVHDSGLRERLAGPLPPLAAAFALGIAGARAAAWLPGTALAAAIFPLAALGVLLARRLARRRSLAALAVAFALAGLLRGRAGFAAAGPGPEAGPGPAPGPGEAPATTSSGTDAGPCAAALARAGLPGPTEAAAAILEVEAAVAGPPTTRLDHAQLLLRIVRARPGARAPPDRPGGPFALADLLADVRIEPGPVPLPGDGVRALLSLDDLSPESPGRDRRAEALARRGVSCTGAVIDRRLAVVDPATGIRPAVERLRRRIARAIRGTLGAGPDAALVAALSVGDRSLIAPAQTDRFAASGLAHLVSISGLHLGLIVLGAFRLLAWALGHTPLAARFDPRRTAATLCLPLVPAYTLLAGADPPVVRAAFAAAAALLATASSRVAAPGPVLAAAALGCLAIEPASLVDPSFQLSFAACAGLLLLGDGLRELAPIPRPPPGAPRWRRVVEALLLTVATTTAATLATLPLTALHFGRVSLVAIPANAIAVPVGSVLTAVAAVAGLVAGIAPGAAAVPLALARPLALLLDGLAAHFAGWPLARVALPTPTAVECVATWAAAGLIAALPRAPRAATAGLVAAIAVAAVPRALAAGGDGGLRIDFLPVGQGDATLLRLPRGGAILVDAGGDRRGDRDVGALRTVPHLAERGVLRLDALVITHLHPDHAGGAPAVLRALPVAEVWTPPGELEGPVGEPLAAAIAETGAVRRILARGEAFDREGVRIEVAAPGPGSASLLENDGSLVLRLVHGEVAVLLPGDVEAPAEAELIAARIPLRATLVKAPHHGSDTSSTAAFVEAVGAADVVFPVGRRNLFRFPSAAVAARWTLAGARLHRTDRGPVSFRSDGTALAPAP
jgi:competence protein ComEC